MDNYNIYDLPYPMFSTTEDQKVMLRSLLPRLESREHYLLCVLLEQHFSERRYKALKNKIQKSLALQSGLWTYFVNIQYLGWALDELNVSSFDLRIVWINKLLGYKGA